MRAQVESAVRIVITVVVATIGAAAGFWHTHSAAVVAGQDGWLAWADAVVIESMVIVAGLQLARDLKVGHRPVAAGSVMVIAFLIQMGSQVAGAPRTPAGWLFAAVPALGCLVIVKFSLRRAPQHRPVPADAVRSAAVRVELPEQREPVAELVEGQRMPAPQPVVAHTAWPPK
jgi:hypothetical protein